MKRVGVARAIALGVLGMLVGVGVAGCSDDEGPALVGVGADCVEDRHCDDGQTCITDFRGGYCSVADCSADADCPEESACASFEGQNYCLKLCTTSVDCNASRGQYQALCSDSLDLVEAGDSRRVCRPPMG